MYDDDPNDLKCDDCGEDHWQCSCPDEGETNMDEDFQSIINGADIHVDVDSIKGDLNVWEKGDRVTFKRGGPIMPATVVEVFPHGDHTDYMIWIDAEIVDGVPVTPGVIPCANRHLRKIV